MVYFQLYLIAFIIVLPEPRSNRYVFPLLDLNMIRTDQARTWFSWILHGIAFSCLILLRVETLLFSVFCGSFARGLDLQSIDGFLGSIAFLCISPRQLILTAGMVTMKIAPSLVRLYEQMPELKYVIATAACIHWGNV